jgi:PKD repeat protein
MKEKLIVSVFFMLTLACSSQNTTICGVDDIYKVWLKQHPGALHEGLQKSNASKIATAPVYTIPIVFHILHQYGPENISDAQVIDAVNILNRDYRKLNADTAGIYPPFVAADARFEFRLATRDTNGNCTTGIIHHYDPNTNWPGVPANPSCYAYTWNPSRYLNVYVVKQIPGFSYGGYSSFPGTNTPKMDVIVFMSISVGSIGTSAVYRSRVLTHEVGHFFNLQHTWAIGGTYQSVCGDDYVNDTPITKGFGGCPAQAQTAVCNPTIQENMQNYMDYSSCHMMFTPGQVARMTAAITSTVGGRNNLWTNSNLIATGVINPISPCAPIADFYPNTLSLCAGSGHTFIDASTNGSVTSWSWSVSAGAIISNPTVSVTAITFNSAGIYTVTLIAANGTGSSTVSKTVSVLSSAANVGINYSESFESPGLPANFNIVNPDNDVTWIQTSQAAATGSNCYYIDGSADAPASFPDILETPSYDFSQDPNASFTFKYAYAKKDNSSTDVFKVLASGDCGFTWIEIYHPTNSFMASASGGISNTPFIPTPGQFATYTLSNHPNFSPFLGLSWVKIRFSFTEDSLSGYGNNIFLDDINFNSYRTAGLETISKNFGCALYPNPSNGTSTLEFELSDASEVVYALSNTIGELLFADTKTFNPGKHSISINEDGKLKPGLYFANISINKQRLIKKLIITSK